MIAECLGHRECELRLILLLSHYFIWLPIPSAPALSHPESDSHTYKLYILVIVLKFHRINKIPFPQLFYFHVILFALSI